MTHPATLVLADGTIFKGIAIGQEGHTVGEVIFNTAMIGYQETLTDPASTGKLITFTYPHIGNTGVNSEDNESDRVRAAGLIIRDLPLLTSNFRTEARLEDYLRRHKTTGIAGIDTRRLTRHLRTFGTQAGCIVTGDNPDIAAALKMAQNFHQEASSSDLSENEGQHYEWQEGAWHLGQSFQQPGENPLHVVVVDLGVTREILRHFVDNGCRVTVVSKETSASDILTLNPDGLFYSNGAGNPEAQLAITETMTEILASKIPLFAVGLGHQLLGIALGGKVTKSSHGYHGANHPVQEIVSGKVVMTHQNQSYTLVEESLPEAVIITHHSLIDQSVQGMRLQDQFAYSFQGYPEGDAAFLFDQLIDAMWTQ